MTVVDTERQLGRAYPLRQAVLLEVIAVEGDIQRAHRRLGCDGSMQGIGNPDTAGMNADKGRVADLPRVQMGAQLVGHAAQQAVDRGKCTHGVSLLWPLSQVCSSRAAARLSTGSSR